MFWAQQVTRLHGWRASSSATFLQGYGAQARDRQPRGHRSLRSIDAIAAVRPLLRKLSSTDGKDATEIVPKNLACLLYTSPSPRD